jgi:site-specific DNA recombinase
MIAAIYARKSTDQNLPDAEKSVTRQVEHATAYAARKGWTVDPAHVYIDDGISGAEFVNRPGLGALLSRLSPRAPFGVLAMAEASRLGREQIELAYVLKRLTDAGVRVFYYLDDREAVLDSALDKVLVSLTGFGAELEREKARARTYDALERKAKAGHVAGGLVYGYMNVRVEGHIERRILEAEAAAVRRIFERYAGGAGLAQIAAELTRAGLPTPAPRRHRKPGWTGSAILAILCRPLYAGVMVWGARKKTDVGGRTKVRKWRPEAERIRVAVPALRIVPEEVWHAVQARRTHEAKTRPGWSRQPGPLALLAGIGKCQCGSAMTRNTRTHGGPGRRHSVWTYSCGRKPRCHSVELRTERVETAVLDALAKALKPETIEAAVRQAVEEERRERAGASDRRATLERDLRAVQARISRLTEAVAAGTGATAPLLAKLTEEEGHRQTLEREKATLEGLDQAAELATAAVRRALLRQAARIRKALDEHPTEARDVLAAFVPRLAFTPTRKVGRAGFNSRGPATTGRSLETRGLRGVPDGIRTRVSRLKIWGPGPA